LAQGVSNELLEEKVNAESNFNDGRRLGATHIAEAYFDQADNF
jgi:hypothetical protein